MRRFEPTSAPLAIAARKLKRAKRSLTALQQAMEYRLPGFQARFPVLGDPLDKSCCCNTPV